MVGMSSSIAQYLRSLLDREESDALLISGGGGFEPMRWKTCRDEADPVSRDIDGPESYSPIYGYDRQLGDPPETDGRVDTNPVARARWGRNEDQHIAYWDPRRIVEEVRAKRALIDAIDALDGDTSALWSALAQPYGGIPLWVAGRAEEQRPEAEAGEKCVRCLYGTKHEHEEAAS